MTTSIAIRRIRTGIQPVLVEQGKSLNDAKRPENKGRFIWIPAILWRNQRPPGWIEFHRFSIGQPDYCPSPIRLD